MCKTTCAPPGRRGRTNSCDIKCIPCKVVDPLVYLVVVDPLVNLVVVDPLVYLVVVDPLVYLV